MIHGQSWREQEFLLIFQKHPCNLCSHCQKKGATTFRYEDFPTDLKKKIVFVKLETAIWKTGEKNGEKATGSGQQKEGRGEKLQVFSGCEVLRKY